MDASRAAAWRAWASSQQRGAAAAVRAVTGAVPGRPGASGRAGVILRLTWLGAAAARAGVLVDDFPRDTVIQSGARGLAAANGAGGALAWTSFLDPSPRAQPAPSTWPCPLRVCSFVLSVVPPPKHAYRSQSLIPTPLPPRQTRRASLPSTTTSPRRRL